MRAKIDWLLPKYARWPLLLVFIMNTVVYVAPSRLFVTDVARYDLTIALDVMLPCVPFFLLFYVLAYVQWAGSYIFHSHDSVRLCYHLAAADIIAKLLCLMFFIFLPTQMARPEAEGSGLFGWGLRLVYAIDNPVNPFTGKPINNAEKTAHDQFIIESGEWDVNVNNGNNFIPSGWYSVTSDIWDKSDWEYYPEAVVLKEHAMP